MNEITYTNQPRILEDGTNLDNDIVASHPVIKYRNITDPVNDGSLGLPAYAETSQNRDGTPL